MTSARHPAETGGELPRKRPLTSLITGAIAIGILIAGCGGSNSPGSSNSASSGGSTSQIRKQFVVHAACMRSHGVPGYPDPVVSGSADSVSVTISPGDANPNSPSFRSADRACRYLLPSGVAPGPSSAGQQAHDLAFADCMRSHGVPGFPDAGRDGVFTLPARINQQAPAFLRAYHACPQPSSLSIDQTPSTGSP